jgi:hypothetical protein
VFSTPFHTANGWQYGGKNSFDIGKCLAQIPSLLETNSEERTYITKHGTPLKPCFTMRNGASGAIEKLRGDVE